MFCTRGTRYHNPHGKSWALLPVNDTCSKLSLFYKFGSIVDGLLESASSRNVGKVLSEVKLVLLCYARVN